MKITMTVAAITLATLTAPAAAQPEAEITTVQRPRTLTADPIVSIPIGDAENAAGIGFGASGTLNFPINANLDVTGRLGLIYHLPKNDIQVILVPIYGGVRYRLSPFERSLYGAAEAGITWGRASVDTGFGEASDSDAELGGTLGVGYATPGFDIRASLMFPDLGEADDALAIVGSISFRLADF